jgi:hypothetical protein
MNIEIQPTHEQIERWITEYVPHKELFFVREEDLAKFEDYLHDVLVMPEQEFFEHASYRQIELVNRYVYWRTSKDVEFVIVAHSNWITNLRTEQKRELFEAQVKLERGLIFPVSMFSDMSVVPEEFIIEDNVVVQHVMWKELPLITKEQVLKEYAKQWDSWTSIVVPTNIPSYLQKYANTFSSNEGSNCLAATLFAVTGQEWMIHEWLHPKTFMNGLKHAGYFVVKDELREDDVVVWQDEYGNIQHASYYVGDHLLFNKNGQTIFNPWKIVQWEEVSDTWKQYVISIYRRESDNTR